MKRIQILKRHIQAVKVKEEVKDTLTVLDNRTGVKYELPIRENMISAKNLSTVKDSKGNITKYIDPGYLNTVSGHTRVSFVDGEQGILEYRGYSIKELAEKSTFIEVAYLLIYEDLPTIQQLEEFSKKIMNHSSLPIELRNIMSCFKNDAHPMGMFISAMSGLSTFHPEANPALAGQSCYDDPYKRDKHISNILGISPTISAAAYRHKNQKEFNNPRDGGYIENFFYMLHHEKGTDYQPHPVLVKALDVMFILHAEHGFSCSAAAVRHLASANTDVYNCIAGGAAALYGTLHGGANEAVLRMLMKIGSKANVPAFIEKVKNKEEKLMGFGHRMYKCYEIRPKIVKTIALKVFEVCGREELFDVALEIEQIALKDPYFIKRRLFPNIDLFSGVVYKAMGFPPEFCPVLFAMPRLVSWLAHWSEFLDDPNRKITRPQQVYTGHRNRKYVPQCDIKAQVKIDLEVPNTITEAQIEPSDRYMNP
ncbi:unnamed protein product [Moneuplotes crassus]|uniref:Citrate synthase n=1 Tax=Euplotes crassus TaxID=5936 RepID=A0AAD1UBY9_EUPCR|nr:unnamed protein product [Moneuplotes crassus]